MVLQILTFLGGLALLMFGLKNMTESLQKLAGESLGKFLGVMGKNRFTGLFSGAAITATIQSSTATTLLTVTFVNAGLFTLNQAIPIIMGANIGTTITAWIMSLGFSFDMGKIVYPIFVIGIICIYMKRSKIKTLGDFVFGLAFLFFGLTILKSNAEAMDLGNNETVINFFKSKNDGGFGSMMLFLLVGGVLTFCVQSSAAIVAFTQLLCASGVLQIDQGIALVLGENIGTTITSNISAMKASASARRTALAHLMFNLFGVLWVCALFSPFNKFVAHVWGFGDFHSITPEQLPKFIAAFHTSFNVCNVLLLIGFVNQMEKIIEKIIKKNDEDSEGKLKYIGGSVSAVGDSGMFAAVQETFEMAQRMEKMFGFVEQLTKESSNKTKEYEALYKRIDKYENISDNMEIEISKYLAKISKDHLSNDAKIKSRVILKVISELESIGDSGANIARSIQRRYESKANLTEDQQKNIEKMYGIVKEALTQMLFIIKNFETIKEADVKMSYAIEDRINNLRQELREENIENITAKRYDYLSGVFYMDIISGCEKIGDFIINIVQEYKRLKFKK
ncbi:MAG: Na/Pi cotransporter family protein [Bacteroidales bacterium]|nr:Na/Pi cotransporter family protein [Bacteroidales bacterium]